MKRVQHLGPTVKDTIKRFLMKAEKPKISSPSVILSQKHDLMEVLGNII